MEVNMSKKVCLSQIAIILWSAGLFAQAPDTLWTKHVGGSMVQQLFCVQQTYDGSYIAVGQEPSSGGIILTFIL
jgi:hypothetical protein